MRRILLLTLVVCCSIVMMAGDITPEQALQQAASFMNGRVANGSRRAPVTEQQLTMTQQVSGLYVFNVTNNGGFVIVSNDDVATPILGYSDSGSFDPNNIPSNMRAWLQGYADEIAWAKQHIFTKNTGASIHRASAVKTPIAPIVQTHWNQDTPYNDLCPVYSGTTRAATGCVATAMAQCMYAAEMRAGSTTTTTTAAIPSYTTDTRSLSVDGIAAGTAINWDKMQKTYPATGTNDEKTAANTAIAQLMLYCGVSVEMDYGVNSSGESGAQSYKVADALKNYFGYKSTTTYVNRSFYTYAEWIELMYYELSQGRPICYGGQKTSGGGHEFVCDGYQGEDYFHINWGWGGLSDNYFKLSALDPDAEGIGGIASAGGYRSGQEAIIGIQKEEESGSMSDITPNTIDLKLTGYSFSGSPTQYQEVEATLTIKNNGDKDYDGDIGVRCMQYSGGWTARDDVSNTFHIPANSSKDIKLTFTPQYSGDYTLWAYVPSSTPGYIEWIDVVEYPTVTVAAGGGGGIEYTDNVTLSTSTDYDMVIDGSSFYGNTFSATMTVTNNTTSNYQGQFQLGIFDNSNSYEVCATNVSIITVPANSSIQLPIKATNLTYGHIYEVSATYVKNGGNSGWLDQGAYKCTLGITITDAAGNSNALKPTASFTVPASATSVDLTGCGVTSVTKNSNPNCLYILGSSDAVPTGLTNVITNTSGTYTAANITLTDGKDFYSPVDFTASNIEFNYTFTTGADGSSGWNTLILPFDVSKVTADGTEIKWFTNSSDTGKDFWVKKFISDESNIVNFDYTDKIEANTPYILALPGDHWGAEYDLSGKTIKFIGTDAEINASGTPVSVTGSNYRFIGSTTDVYTENIYCINATGNKFELKATGGSKAFRAFFKPGIFDRSVTMLSIGGGDGTTGLIDVRSKTDEVGGNVYYDLQGHRVLYPKKELYILNGKKVIIK